MAFQQRAREAYMHREYLKELENNNHNMFELSLIVERFRLDLYIYIYSWWM